MCGLVELPRDGAKRCGRRDWPHRCELVRPLPSQWVLGVGVRPLLREAFQLVADGVVTRDEIDVAVTHGLGLRWAEAGPFALSAIGGGTGGMRHMLDHLGPALNHWWASMGGFILDEAAKELLLAPSPVFHPAPTDPEPYRRFVQAMRTSLAQSSP